MDIFEKYLWYAFHLWGLTMWLRVEPSSIETKTDMVINFFLTDPNFNFSITPDCKIQIGDIELRWKNTTYSGMGGTLVEYLWINLAAVYTWIGMLMKYITNDLEQSLLILKNKSIVIWEWNESYELLFLSLSWL